MTETPFLKMHGLGNDFIIIDTRKTGRTYTAATAIALANRRTGIGCDQFITIESSAKADVRMGILNADGSRVSACGNATRCVARLIIEETGQETIHIETDAGILTSRKAEPTASDVISVNMGSPCLDWHDIPLVSEMDTLSLPISMAGYDNPTAINIGNPHMVFFVDDAGQVPLQDLGPMLEHHPLFPERANVEFAQIFDRQTIRMRVWERGAGITMACGTGACATLIAAVRHDKADRTAKIILDGGELLIHWDQDNQVWMTGPATLSYSGHVDINALTAGGA